MLLALAGVVVTPTVPARGEPERSARTPWVLLAQADTTSNPSAPQTDESDDEEDNGVPIPPNLLEPEPNAVPPDTTGAPDSTGMVVPPARSDSTGLLIPSTRSDSTGLAIPANPAQQETIRYVQPVDPTSSARTAPPVVTGPKHRGGIFGLTPAVVILSLAVLHFFIVQTVK